VSPPSERRSTTIRAPTKVENRNEVAIWLPLLHLHPIG
jgi:hypothetical protein